MRRGGNDDEKKKTEKPREEEENNEKKEEERKERRDASAAGKGFFNTSGPTPCSTPSLRNPSFSLSIPIKSQNSLLTFKLEREITKFHQQQLSL